MTGSPSCVICARQNAAAGNSSGLVYEDGLWSVRHSAETDILGYLVMESHRHFLDLSEADGAELTSLGPILSHVMKALRSVTGYHRLYTVTLAELVPHFHMHLIPRTEAVPKAYRGRGILDYPLAPHADPGLVEDVCLRLRLALRRVPLI